jgi:hypothetical protein
MKTTWLLIVILLSQVNCISLPNKYSAKEIEAWVVDADTGKPLEGVIVVAAWELKGGLELGNPVGNANLMETVTDKNGRFYFPAWGPVWKKGALLFNDPNLYFFKRDYEYRALPNKFSFSDLETGRGSVRSSDWHGKTIKLKKFQGSLEEYAWHLSSLDTGIETILDVGRRSKDCEWKKVPKLLVAFSQLKDIFRENKIPFIDLTSIDDLPTGERCGSPQLFFKRYLP